MLELIRHWLVGITCAAMLVALAESLIPAGSIRRIARLTGGLVLLAAILNPLLKLDTTALTRALTEYKLELSAYSADLEEENEILMKDIIEEQSGAYIQDKAAALGDEDVKQAAADVEKALGSDGRLLLRQSGTEPLIRVMVEAESTEICEKYVDQVIGALRKKGHAVS